MVNENRNEPAGMRCFGGATTVELFPREGEYTVSFNKDIIWRKRRWLNHLDSEYLLTTSPEQDDQTANDPESAQRDWKHIAVIPVSDSLPH